MSFDKLYVYQHTKAFQGVYVECPVIRETKTRILVNDCNRQTQRQFWVHKEELEERGYHHRKYGGRYCTRKYLDWQFSDGEGDWRTFAGLPAGTEDYREFGKLKTRAEIIKDFREKAKACHPDLGGDPEAFRKLVEEKDRALKFAA